jgi:cytochrome c biogenesis factor
MKNTMITDRIKKYAIVVLILIGAALGILTLVDGSLALPTYFWPANLLIPVAAGAIVYMVVTFVRFMAGREPGAFTMKRMGRNMLHLGMIILLLGVFMSENVVHEAVVEFQEDDYWDLGSVSVRVTEIDRVRWVSESDFLMVVTVQVIEESTLLGAGFVTMDVDSQWGMMTHGVYFDSIQTSRE